jgi:aminoglycoside/choline kinase family phosphotransferase
MSDLLHWVARQLALAPDTIALVPVSGDAGFRRYFRLQDGGGRSLVVMDASADRASCTPFRRIGELLAGGGVRVPAIVAADMERGFLLLDDLGRRTLLEVVDDANADRHYGAAIEALVRLQRIAPPTDLPRYDEALLRRELALFPDWYLARHCGAAVTGELKRRLESAFDLLVARALAQPAVLVHRDYMPRNLMPGDGGPGVLDFQDAVIGPVSYDPVCLFKDAFLSWPEARVVGWLRSYWARARAAGVPVPAEFERFYTDCDFMGVHRHLKVIGIFARLCHRDGKPGYLADAPRFFAYLEGACARRAELAPLGELLRGLAP